MAKTKIGSKFGTINYLIRLVAATVLVFGTYNPEYSYYQWFQNDFAAATKEMKAIMIFVGVVIIIGWAIFIRATYRSLGFFGTILAIAFFGSLLALLIVFEIVPKDNIRAMTYLVLFGVAGVLSAGISWSHVRRRMTGQIDVDETDN